MTVRLENGAILLEGSCRIEEAETLLALLAEDSQRSVDLSLCGSLHTAVAQILLAAKPFIIGAPDDRFFCAHLLPLLRTGGSPSSPASQ